MKIKHREEFTEFDLINLPAHQFHELHNNGFLTIHEPHDSLDETTKFDVYSPEFLRET